MSLGHDVWSTFGTGGIKVQGCKKLILGVKIQKYLGC